MHRIIESIFDHASPSKGAVFVNGDAHTSLSWQQMLTEASAYAAVLHEHHGINPGSRVAVLASTSKETVLAIESVWLAGGCITMLPLPTRLSALNEFIVATRKKMRASDTDLLIIDADFVAFFDPQPGDPPTVTLKQIDADAALCLGTPWEPPHVTGDSLAVLQFTSGSTNDPKGVMVTYDKFAANLDAIAERIVDHDTRFVSWLPLFHDMGLIGLLSIPMTRGIPLVQAAPQDFMADPTRWMRWIADYRGTFTAAPNFAYSLAARFLETEPEPLDLSSLTIALNGAEPVHPNTMRQFVSVGARHGLNPGCVFPAFGMAEIALAGAFPPIGRGLVTDRIDSEKFTTDHVAVPATPDVPSKEQVLLGTVLTGLSLRIVNPDTGQVLPVRHVGELEIEGNSVTPGYYKNPEATAAAFRDGWLRTGDLAYLTEDDELVICGRIKDLIVVAGRNIYPQDIEVAAAAVPGIRPGNVIAFGVEGEDTEQVVVVAESKDPTQPGLKRAVKHHVAQHCDVTPRTVVIVPPGTIPKTSSGKLQRAACKTTYQTGGYQP